MPCLNPVLKSDYNKRQLKFNFIHYRSKTLWEDFLP